MHWFSRFWFCIIPWTELNWSWDKVIRSLQKAYLFLCIPRQFRHAGNDLLTLLFATDDSRNANETENGGRQREGEGGSGQPTASEQQRALLRFLMFYEGYNLQRSNEQTIKCNARSPVAIVAAVFYLRRLPNSIKRIPQSTTQGRRARLAKGRLTGSKSCHSNIVMRSRFSGDAYRTHLL